MSQNGLHEGGVGIAEAAKILKVSPAALRKRVHRGSTPAYKGDDGNWYVLIEQARDLTTNEEMSGEEPPTLTTPAAAQDIPRDRTSDAPLYQELVSTLKDEVRFLRSELEQRTEELAQRTEEIRRRDYLMAQMAHRPAELPSGHQPPIETASTRRPWYKLW